MVDPDALLDCRVAPVPYLKARLSCLSLQPKNRALFTALLDHHIHFLRVIKLDLVAIEHSHNVGLYCRYPKQKCRCFMNHGGPA